MITVVVQETTEQVNINISPDEVINVTDSSVNEVVTITILESESCQPATYRVINSLGEEQSNGTIASGDSADITANDSTVSILNTAEQELFGVQVPSGVSQNVIVPDATAHLKKENGGTLRNVDIPAGVSTPIIIANSVITLKNTADEDLDQYSVHAEDTLTITAPDAVVRLKDTAGNILSTTNEPSGTTNDLTAPNAIASLRDSAGNLLFNEPILSGSTENITAPNATVTLNGSAFLTPRSGQTVAATLVDLAGNQITGQSISGAQITIPYFQNRFLDTVSNAQQAISLTLLRGSYYGNACLRVRRSGDNQETNVFFDTSGNVSDSSPTTAGVTFGTWRGVASVFIVYWFDQSVFGRDYINITPSTQPRLVNAGTYETLNGKIAVNSLGTTLLQTPSSAAYFNFLHNGSAWGILAVMRHSGAASTQVLLANNNSGANEVGIALGASTLNRAYIFIPNGANPDFSILSNNDYYTGVQQINLITNLSGNIVLNRNGTQFQSITNSTTKSTANATAIMNLFQLSGASTRMNCLLQELIIFDTNVSTAVQATRNAFYGAY